MYQVKSSKQFLRSKPHSEELLLPPEALKSFLVYRNNELLTLQNEVIVYNNEHILKNNLSVSYQNKLLTPLNYFQNYTRFKTIIEELHRPKNAKNINVLSKDSRLIDLTTI
jgi:integrase/recombinase XerD